MDSLAGNLARDAAGERLDWLFTGSFHGKVGTVVLPGLVSGRAGKVFRCASAAMGDVARIVGDHRVCPLPQHRGFRDNQSEAGRVANVPAVSDALLCVEFCSAGEGPWFYFDFLAAAFGDCNCGGVVRDAGDGGPNAEAEEGRSISNSGEPIRLNVSPGSML